MNKSTHEMSEEKYRVGINGRYLRLVSGGQIVI